MIDCENMINAAKACLVLTEPIKVTLRAWVSMLRRLRVEMPWQSFVPRSRMQNDW